MIARIITTLSESKFQEISPLPPSTPTSSLLKAHDSN